MKNLPSEERPSTQLIRDLYKNRKKLVRIENSDSPFIKRINPLLKKDYWLSHALIKFLNYEYDLGIKFKDTGINFKSESKEVVEQEEDLF